MTPHYDFYRKKKMQLIESKGVKRVPGVLQSFCRTHETSADTADCLAQNSMHGITNRLVIH